MLHRIGSMAHAIRLGSVTEIGRNVLTANGLRIDFAFVASAGERAIVEAQLGQADYDHAMRTIIYGDAHKARYRILVASDFRESILSTLRKQNEDMPNVCYYAVRLRVTKDRSMFDWVVCLKPWQRNIRAVIPIDSAVRNNRTYTKELCRSNRSGC